MSLMMAVRVRFSYPTKGEQDAVDEAVDPALPERRPGQGVMDPSADGALGADVSGQDGSCFGRDLVVQQAQKLSGLDGVDTMASGRYVLTETPTPLFDR
jgi:hypothetical protein